MKTDGSDAGPAFPTQQSAILQNQPSEGMSLRDYFAAKAVCGMLGSPFPEDADTDSRGSWLTFAKRCYAIADAMLEARK